jgi:hypothetical protein
MAKRTSINLFVPVALVRNRTQSDADKRQSAINHSMKQISLLPVL